MPTLPPPGRRALAALGLLLALGPAAGSAQPYDPRLTWRTLETPHFRIHFHQGLPALAGRVAAAAERAHAALVPRFAGPPSQRTEIVLVDASDASNGLATPLPYDTIRLYAVPPEPGSELNDARDWLEALVVHEYVHILHLDTVGGVPAALNAVFGKIYTPAALGPPLLTEGLAVLHEADGASAGADGGRNRSALFDMYARALTEDGPYPRLDEVVGQTLAWPRGDVPYLLGGRFTAWVQARAGAEAWPSFMHAQGRQLWPWNLGGLAQDHLGDTMQGLWAGFEAEERAHAEAVRAAVRARPVTAAEPLTRRGSQVGSPRWLPDGSGLVYDDVGPDEAPGLRRVGADGREDRAVATVWGTATFALRSSREAVVASPQVFQEFSLWSDLTLVPLGGGAPRPLTRGERAYDPDLTPDGLAVVYAVHLPGGETALRRRPLAGGPAETLFQREGVQVSSPRVSPDGRTIAFEHAERGRRDLALLREGRLTFLTDDDAIDLAPAWSPDGTTIFFSSERTGVYDVYAFTLADGPAAPAGPDGRVRAPGRLAQVTNVVLGAFEPEPSPDGRTLAFVTYSRRGYDLATLPLDPAAWQEPAPARSRPLRGPQAPAAAPAPELASRPYRALDTALPSLWLPWVGVDGGGTTLGALTAGVDVLQQHAWVAQGWYGLESREPGYAATYVGQWTYPRLVLSSQRIIGTTPGSPALLEERWTPLQVALRFTDTAVDRQAALSFGWRALHLAAMGGVPGHLDPGVQPYRDGTASEWSLGLTFTDAHRFVNAISREEGRVLALSLRAADPALGGDFSYAGSHASISQYLRVPGAGHAVVALRAAAGVASGTLGGRQPFTLGGAPATDVSALLLESVLGPAVGPDLLRGYPLDAFGGSTLVNGNLELRVPLLAPERGWRTWPVQLRRVHAAAFLDTGSVTPAGAAHLEPFHFGAGAELRLEVVLSYVLRTEVRFGVAQGLGTLSGAPDPLAGFQAYVSVGPAF